MGPLQVRKIKQELKGKGIIQHGDSKEKKENNGQMGLSGEGGGAQRRQWSRIFEKVMKLIALQA